jgi:hypothetical protein
MLACDGNAGMRGSRCSATVGYGDRRHARTGASGGTTLSMCRVVLCAAVALLVAAPPAAGATISLRDDLRASGVALGGSDVLVMRELRNGTTQLIAVPRTGGRARTLLSVPSVQPVFETQRALSASDARVALITEILGRRDQTVEWRVYSGPPSGPLQIVRRIPEHEGWEPVLVDVDGDRLLIVEAREEKGDAARAYILDPAFGLVPVAWASDAVTPVAIAGGRAAVYARQPRRVAVVDLATGAEQAAVPLGKPTERLDLDLAADGRVLVSARAGISVASPGAALQTVPGSRGLSRASFVGAAMAAFYDSGHPVLVGLDGTRTALGPPSRVLTAFAGDPHGFAWVANGCIRYAAFPVTASAPQAHDPCPTTEIGLYLIADSKLRGRTVRVPVRCVTAPTGVCRGTVLGRDGEGGRRVVARGRFAVPVGKERRVPMRIERETVERFRRKNFGFFIVDARIPNGRIGVGAHGSSELGVDLG